MKDKYFITLIFIAGLSLFVFSFLKVETQTILQAALVDPTGNVVNIDQAWLDSHGPSPYFLSQANTTYMLNTDVTTSGTAFVVGANNVIFDLNNHTVTFGSVPGFSGVPNGDFEQNSANWDLSNAASAKIVSTSEMPLMGNWVLKLENPTVTQEIISDWAVVPVANRTYIAIALVQSCTGCTMHLKVEAEDGSIISEASSANVAGGVTGKGNVVLNGSGSSQTTIQTTSINNTGTITNQGSTTGATSIPAVIGANVTGVIQNSSTSQLTLSGANANFGSAPGSGGVTIKSGTVYINTNDTAAGTGTITIGDTTGSTNATLMSGTLTVANAITAASGNSGTLTISNTTSTASAPHFDGLITLANNLTIDNVRDTNSMTFDGGTAGTGNLTIKADGLGGTGAGTINIRNTSLNHTGTITNSGAGIGLVTISGGIGANVTAITQNSTTSALTISTTALTVNGTATTLTNSSGTKALTVSGGTTGTGNLIINNNSSTVDAITLTTTSVNHAGTITNSGSGSGRVTLSADIGSAVTGVIQNSATSQLTLSGNNANFGSAPGSGGVTIKSGTAQLQTSVNAAGTGTITIGDTSGSSDAVLSTASIPSNPTTFSNAITTASGNSGTLSIKNTTATYGAIYSGTITLNNNLTISPIGGGAITLSGSILTGSGTTNIITNAASTGAITLSNASINPTGTITNSGSGSGITTISGILGSNVTGITQNSATSGLTLSGDGSTVGAVTISSGTLTLSASKNLNVSGGWTNSGTFTAGAGSTVTLTSGTHTITGANTFDNLTLSANNTVTFPASTTQAIGGTMTCTGTAGNTITINSSNPGTQATLSKSSGTVTCDYLSLRDSAAEGGATWTAGDHSTRVSNVTGWTGANTAPVFNAGPSDGDTLTNVGSNVTFTATADDSESDAYYLAICKTNAITANVEASPTCTGGQWCKSGSTADNTQSTCNYTALDADDESNDWYAFACDHYVTPACSASTSGSFDVNHAPSFGAITDTTDPVASGDAITFSTIATDIDTGDTVTLYVCKTNAFAANTCTGGEWCHSTASLANPTCAYTAAESAGTYDYHAFVVDSHSMSSASNPKSSTFTINTAPTITVDPSDGETTPTVGQAVTFTATGTDSTSYYLAVCKTDSITANSEAAPDCASSYCVSTETASGAQASCSYTTTTSGANNWYAYLCDKSTASACTAAVQGSFTANTATAAETTTSSGFSVGGSHHETPTYPETPNIVTQFFVPPPLEEKKIEVPPLEQTVKHETPEAMKGEWNLLSTSKLEKFVLSPLPEDFNRLSEKFPEFNSMVKNLSINTFQDLVNLNNYSIDFPGLKEAAGVKPNTNVPLSQFTDTEKKKVPYGVVFATFGMENIDAVSKLSVTSQGFADQKINAVASKPINLVVKPEYEAKNIKGYIIFKAKLAEKKSFWPFVNAQEQRLLLNEFEYKDDDHDGIYTATIESPVVDGNYDIMTVIDYKDESKPSKVLHLLTVVDPEGYIYQKSGNNETRIKGATVSLFWENKDKEYVLWPGKDFAQENPQTTDSTGKYSFLVPEGSYFVRVEGSGYRTYQTEPFDVKEGSGVHMNIQLTNANIFLRIFEMSITNVLLAVIAALLLILIFVIFKKFKNNKNI